MLQNQINNLSHISVSHTWSVIERIKLTLNLSNSELANMLLFTDKEFEKFSLRKKDIPVDKVFAFAERLGLNIDNIVTGEIDYPALAQHYLGNKNILPERYMEASFGKRRTYLFILDYIEKNYGWKQRLSILRHFQLNETIFSNPDEMINFRFGSDLSTYLYRYKLGEKALAQVGVHSFLASSTENIKHELSECKNIGEIYEKMCESIIKKYFEKNFSYRILKMKNDKCTISAKPNPQLEQSLESQTISNPAISIIRKGIAAAYPMILGLPPAKVQLSASLHLGDHEDRYEIDFSEANASMGWN